MSVVQKKAAELEQLKLFAQRSKSEAEKAAKSAADSITIPTKVSELTNDVNFQTEAEVAALINAKVSSTYKAGGSVAFSSLPALTANNLGLVVNVTNAFTTTADFIEGAGKKYPAGTNVVVIKTDSQYKYDILAGFVDLSGYATIASLNSGLAGKVNVVAGKGLSANDFTDADKEKLDSITFASDTEFNDMLNEIYGTGT